MHFVGQRSRSLRDWLRVIRGCQHKWCTVIYFLCGTFSLFSSVVKVGPSEAIHTIKEGIAVASSGDTLLISAGTYHESEIDVNKALHMIGLQYPIIDGGGKSEVLLITSDSVIVEGVQVQNVQANYIADIAGIKLKEVKHVTLRNNKVIDTFFGIYLQHCRDIRIEGNTVKSDAELEMSSGNAIHLWYCKHVVIVDNEVAGHRDGIYLEFVEHSEVFNNISMDNIRYGLHFMFSNYDTYFDNVFSRNGAGVAVMFSNHIDMRNNEFIHNWGEASYGLLLKEIYDAEIINNKFVKNCIGIFVEGSSRINYQGNLFQSNGWALKISGGCLDNKVEANSFVSNTFDVAFHGTKNENSFDGNYWSAYNGYDLDRNDVGDIPYRPVKLFNFIVNQTPEAIVLLRSLFVDLVNFAEKVNPLYTPKNIVDHKPLMQSPYGYH